MCEYIHMHMEVILSHSPPDSSSLRQGLTDWPQTYRDLPASQQADLFQERVSLIGPGTHYFGFASEQHRDSPVSVFLALYFIKVYFCT